MKIRFELQSLSALGEGAHRLPINCWRLTIHYQQPVSPSRNVLLDGIDLLADLSADPSADGSHLSRTVVGGVIVDGMPVNLDQVLRVNVPSSFRALGFLVYEYLEP